MRHSVRRVGFITSVTVGILASSVGFSAADKIEFMYAARDLCTGLAAKFANAQDKTAEISYDQGKFKVTAAKGGVTVLEDSVEVAKLAAFDYSNYVQCLEKMTAVAQ